MPNAPSDRPTLDISTLTPEEYTALGESERERVHHLAFCMNKPLADQAFADPDVAWILIAGSPGKIVSQGKRNERLSDAQITEKEAETGKVCFFYSRPDIVEEIPRPPRFPWQPKHFVVDDKERTIGPFVDSQAIARARARDPGPYRYEFPDLDHAGWPPPYRLHELTRNR